MAEIRDLWPADIGETSMVPPVAILREQAALLGRKTRQLLRAHVNTDSNGPYINHFFIIYAPAIDYTLELFRMTHEINLYPIGAIWRGEREEINDENELLEYLKKVFGSNDTKKTIHSLLAQVRTEGKPNIAEETGITDEDIPF